MTPPPKKDFISIPEERLEEMLNRAAEKGARRALADVGLEGDDAESDIQELRSLLQAFNLAKRTMWVTFVRIATAGMLLTLMAGAAIKLKFIGGE